MKTCSIEGCDRPFIARDRCQFHWRLWRQSPDYAPVAELGPICVVEGCEKLRGGGARMCYSHDRKRRKYGDPHAETPPRPKGDPSERFWAKVEVAGGDECWIFTGTILGNGYGQFTSGKAFRTSAHRFAYEDRVGPIPPGLTIDHLCCVRACVNPAHLEPVTAEENIKRRWRRQREAS